MSGLSIGGAYAGYSRAILRPKQGLPLIVVIIVFFLSLKPR